MMRKHIKESFDEANYLWFYEGYISKAIEKYEEVLRLSGNDPVIAFQLATAMWVLGQKNDTRHYIAIMERHRQILGEEGRRQLDALKRQYETEIPKSAKHGRHGMGFDIEQLEQQNLSDRDWFRIALSAENIGLDGVALRAYELCERGFLDLNLLHDEEDVRFKIEQHLDLLEDMRKEMTQ